MSTPLITMYYKTVRKVKEAGASTMFVDTQSFLGKRKHSADAEVEKKYIPTVDNDPNLNIPSSSTNEVIYIPDSDEDAEIRLAASTSSDVQENTFDGGDCKENIPAISVNDEKAVPLHDIVNADCKSEPLTDKYLTPSNSLNGEEIETKPECKVSAVDHNVLLSNEPDLAATDELFDIKNNEDASMKNEILEETIAEPGCSKHLNTENCRGSPLESSQYIDSGESDSEDSVIIDETVSENQDTLEDPVFDLTDEIKNSELFEDDPIIDAHSKFFAGCSKRHEAELDGIQNMSFIDSSLLEKIIPTKLPNQDEIMRELKLMRPKYRQDTLEFQEQKRATKEALDNVFVLLKQCPGETDHATDPEGLDVSLMQHQKRALQWMLWREKKMPFGGILADDMGLGKTLTMISLILHEKKLLESDESEDINWNLSDGGTLIICPTSLLRQWESEINTKTDGISLTSLIFHGDVHPKDLKRLRSFDVVITTYRSVWGQRAHHLLDINWRRIIVDEAHIIRNVATKTNEAICALRAKHRWALTGTPIHNREEDIFALLKFLRFRPFNDRALWSTWLNDHKRLSVVLRSAMLRRTKTELISQNSIFHLPPRQEETFEIDLSDEELHLHHTVLSFSRTLFEKFLKQRGKRNGALDSITISGSRNNLSKNSKDYVDFLQKLQCDENNIGNFVILVLLLRLRQICCHPGLIEAMLYDDDEDPFKPTVSASTNTNEEETAAEPSSLRTCLSKKNPVFNFQNPSSKMESVMSILNARVLRSGDKAVIVSQWSQFLDIMGDHLKTMGVRVLYFTGRMNVEERLATLENFQKKSSEAKVLLLSLTAGGVGLNLVTANHLFLMEPHWNPQMEAQAQDRIYRLGQNKHTHIYRFICKNSIEERIRSIQEDKLAMAKNILTGAAAVSSGRLTIRDLMKLFGIIDVQIGQN